MKALFWKEVRENWKWALLAAVGITAAMFYLLHRWSPGRPEYLQHPWETLCSRPFLMVSSFGFPVVALGLGFLQILTEQHRDQWAFLVHRPVTRNAIFWGKALSGVAFYILAVLAPLFGMGWWISLPGSIAAPFDWGLVNAPLWDAIAALAFYFAALQAGVMYGPWFGRRLLPLIAVYFGAIAVKNESEFHVAVTGALTILILSIVSAWAAFLSNGSFRHASAWGKAAMVLFGMFGLVVLSGWGGTIGLRWNVPQDPEVSREVGITKDGQAVIVTRQGNLGIKNVVAMDGAKIPPDTNRAFSAEDVLEALSDVKLKCDYQNRRWRSSMKYFEFAEDIYSPPSLWYYLEDSALFVCYGTFTKRVEAWMGPKGLSKTKPADGFNFAGGGVETGGNILISEDSIWYAKLKTNEVQKVYSLPKGEKRLNADTFRLDKNNNEGDPYIVLTTNRNVRLLTGAGSMILSTPQIPNFADYLRVELYAMPDRSRFFLIYIPRHELAPRPPTLLRELSPTGDLLTSREMHAEPDQVWAWSQKKVWDAATMPLGGKIWEEALESLYPAIGIPKWISSYYGQPPASGWPLQLWAISLLVGVACAGVGQILLVRLGICGRERWAWTVFFVFFSYAGLLVLGILHEWPRRKRCAGCGGLRSLELATCGHCGEGWPPRGLDGAEIFEGGPRGT